MLAGGNEKVDGRPQKQPVQNKAFAGVGLTWSRPMLTWNGAGRERVGGGGTVRAAGGEGCGGGWGGVKGS